MVLVGAQMTCLAVYVSLDCEEPYVALERTSFLPETLRFALEVELLLDGVWDRLLREGRVCSMVGRRMTQISGSQLG